MPCISYQRVRTHLIREIFGLAIQKLPKTWHFFKKKILNLSLPLQITLNSSIQRLQAYQTRLSHHKYNILQIFPAIDNERFKIKNSFQQTNDYLLDALSQGNVLVHCYAGISRSATIVIAFLMKFKKWGYEKALHYTKLKREIVNPNLGFRQQLIYYGFELRDLEKKQLESSLSPIEQKTQIVQQIQIQSKNSKSKLDLPEQEENKEQKQYFFPKKQNYAKNLKEIDDFQIIEEDPKTKKKTIQSDQKNDILDNQITVRTKPQNFYQSEKKNVKKIEIFKEDIVLEIQSKAKASSSQASPLQSHDQICQTPQIKKNVYMLASPRSVKQFQITPESTADEKKEFLLDFAKRINYAYIVQASNNSKQIPRSQENSVQQSKKEIQFEKNNEVTLQSKEMKEVISQLKQFKGTTEKGINKVTFLSIDPKAGDTSTNASNNLIKQSTSLTRDGELLSSRRKAGLSLYKPIQI